MWWYDSGGSWLPEEKKANMWPGRGNSGGSWPPAFHRSLYSIVTEYRRQNGAVPLKEPFPSRKINVE